MTKLVFDIDFIIFQAVSVAEERFITALHKPSGRTFEFGNKTELYGHYKKKEGGWIAEENKKNGNDFYKVEDFEVVECQRPRHFKYSGKIGTLDEFGKIRTKEVEPYTVSPWVGAKNILDNKVKEICEKLGTNNYVCYTGKGKTFREDIATLWKYKGNRDDMLRPLLLDKMKDYVVKRHNGILVKDIEADDAYSIAVIEGHNNWKQGGEKVIGIAEDKDSKQTNGWHFNPNKDDAPRLVEGFGKLVINSKDEVDGSGRMWLAFQTMNGDTSDNYKANCFSDIKWGDKAAYNQLKDATNDKELFQALVDGYKKLYPEKKTVIGWSGKEIEIDWLYVLTECFNLAKMMRTYNEKPTVVKDVLDKLKIEY